MSEVKISVIVPIYNSEKYLIKCLDSIINQSYSNLEIILVNDGSTDSSGKIIDNYAAKDQRIVTIHKENGGIGSAYAAAFEKVTGDYISFVDSDDYIENTMYDELVEIVIEKKPDIIHFGRRLINDKCEILKTHITINDITEDNDMILKTHFTFLQDPSLACRLFKSSLFKEVQIFAQNIGIDEIIIIQVLTKCNKAVYITKIFYYTYEREDSVSRILYNEKKIREGLKVHRFICSYLEKQNSKYTQYAHIKYLKYLMEVYDRSSKIDGIKGSQTFNEYVSDLVIFYNKTKKSSEFKNEVLLWRIKLFIFNINPKVYEILRKVFHFVKNICFGV